MAVLAPPGGGGADRLGLLRGAARGGLLNLCGATVAAAGGFAVTWLVARGLGDPARVGAFFTAMSMFVLAAGVARLGTQTSLVYWPARLRALGARQDLARCLHYGLTPVAVASVVVAALLAMVAGWVPAEVAGSLRVLAVFLPLAVLSDALLAATRGYRALGPSVALDKLLRPGLQVLGLGALVSLVAGTVDTPAAFAAAWAAPYLPVAVLAGYTLARVHAAETADGGTVGFSAWAYWSFTAPRAVASVAQLALQRVDVLLVAALGGLPAAALYAVAGRYVVVGQLAGGAVATAVQPRLAERLAVADIEGVRSLYQQATAWLVLATWPLHLLVAANATVYLGLFGPGYLAGTPVVWILAAAMLVASGCGMVDMVLAMAGRTRWNLYNVLGALSTMVVVDLVLVPRYGAVGAALGLAAAVLFNNLVPVAQVRRAIGVHPFGAATRRAMALSVATCGSPLLVAAALGAGPAGLAAVSGLGLACFLAGAYLLRKTLNLHLLKGSRR